ncbi:hypothetical protein HJG54_29425 [Leptolyngbya sp. NK1-12]|uniref:Uncharacterized protein n=1 Tax=Leptolyngbya sp. NK1-12 TaxID=2547451 RepID=A0AA96WYI7_9CYAN|nr:hypothetical protein [Leptolyngbya sp. NK1-12]WNZ27042.1 hypothetical protein HJG54_29425 [Leptolyngbya sp. NK1-12]
MTTTLTCPAWTIEFEIETFNQLIVQYAPHLPLAKLHEPRLPASEQEWQKFYLYRIAGAAHDLFIVQLCAKALDRLFGDDPDVQLLLSRQIGDDGAHSLDTRQRVYELSGHDPVEAITQQVQWHWNYLGDLPTRSWLGFMAWELHYELHIVAILLLTSRLTRINEPTSAQYAYERILPDEFAHRAGVVNWWQREYAQATPGQRSELTVQLLELDEEIQRRRNSYLKDFWQRAQAALGFEIEGFDLIYDAWRREVLSYFLKIPAAQLPKLVSINE